MVEGPASPLFFAVPAPPGLRDLAARVQDEVRRALGPARLPPLEGLHVTLAFLGPMDPVRVPGLLDLAAEAAPPAGASPCAAPALAASRARPGPGSCGWASIPSRPWAPWRTACGKP